MDPLKANQIQCLCQIIMKIAVMIMQIDFIGIKVISQILIFLINLLTK